MNNKPVIGITMGDFNGVGPETIVKSLNDTAVLNNCIPVLIGSKTVFEKISETLKIQIRLNETKKIKDIQSETGVINIFNIFDIQSEEIMPGIPTPKSFETSTQALQYGLKIAKKEWIDGLVTGPICKESLAGTKFPGQTELIAKALRVKDFLMVMVSGEFRVGLITTHTGIKNVSKLLNIELLINKLTILHNALKDHFKIKNPRIGVCALNPHSGEGGLFGSEEKEVIKPAIEKCNKINMNIYGPFPSDTLFIPVNRKKYDAIMAMYHDQGMIPFKVANFKEGVNFSAGLPFIRTSPDHGTAYDIAADFTANPRSMKEAILLNAQLSKRDNS